MEVMTSSRGRACRCVAVSVLAGRVRDAGGADAVAVGDGGQALDVAAEDAADRLGLGLAQLRELVGDVGDRAVLLAQLLAAAAARRAGAATARTRRSPRSEKTRASASAGVSSGSAAVTAS